MEMERLDGGTPRAPGEECHVTEAVILSKGIHFSEDGVIVGGEPDILVRLHRKKVSVGIGIW